MGVKVGSEAGSGIGETRDMGDGARWSMAEAERGASAVAHESGDGGCGE